MKLLLKLLLILCLLLAGTYAAAPLWLSYVLARQLPPGWQLEELQSGYPGLAGIQVDLLRVRGEPGVAGLELTASDIRFEYDGFKTDIGLVSLDVFIRTGRSSTSGSLTMDDLSLPVTKLTGQLPPLSVNRMRVVFHQLDGFQAVANVPARPLVLDLVAFDLTPRPDQGFHLASQLTIAESLQFTGRFEVDVGPDLINAKIRFPTGADLTPWLTVDMVQEDLPTQTTTRISAVLNAGSANREWLDSLLADSTGHLFSQLGGKLELYANFAGQDLQHIKSLSLTGDNLRLVSNGGAFNLNAEVLATREGEEIAVNLPTPAKIQYQGQTAWIDELLKGAVPGLQLTPRSEANIFSEIGSNSSLLFLPTGRPSARFRGDISFDLESSTQTLLLRSAGLQVDAADLYKPEATTAEGLITVNWEVKAPFVYNAEELQLTADKLSMAAEVIARNGTLISAGGGTLIQAHVSPLAYSAEKIDMTWEKLDLDKLTGNLVTRTQGFVTEFDNETWTGFDFDIDYTLHSNSEVSGTGNVKFTSGPKLPFEFAGNTQWSIKLLPATIKLAKLRKLLTVAHIQLPASIQLKDGFIELQGDIEVNDNITAKLLISGHEMAASMHESSAGVASFTFNAGYDTTVWANGPFSIEKIELAGGIDVTHIQTEFEMEDTEHFGFKDLFAEVFDGQLKLGTLQFSENEIADTLAEFSRINLGRLLDYADIDGLEATGFLDISLPVGSDKTGIHVKKGTFASTGPGRLSYTKEGLAGSNIGLTALENFQYKDLSGTLDYQSDGTYRMTIRLEGNNPDLYGGHPVVFNLNINGSLPALFEAMFMTGSFEESILKEIRSR
jgi:hypothetical protein